MNCPLETNPDWKALKKAWGNSRAIQMYIDNKYEVPSVGNNDTSVGNEFGKNTYTAKSVYPLLRDNPSVMKDLVDLEKRCEEIELIMITMLQEKKQ